MTDPQPVHEARDGCTSSYHDTYSAYQRAGCRCPKARDEHRLYQKRGREGRRPPKLIDATRTQRRIRALMAIGHSTATIGEHVGLFSEHGGMSRFSVQQIANNRTKVTPETFRLIDSVYRKLHLTPGTSNLSKTRALRAGYVPPLGWEEGDIDDPDAEPARGHRRGKGRRKLDSGIVDEIALDLVEAGELSFGKLVPAEQVELFRRHRGKATQTTLLNRWGVSHGRMQQIVALADGVAA